MHRLSNRKAGNYKNNKAINLKDNVCCQDNIFYKDDNRKQKDDEGATHDRATCDGAHAC